MLFFVIYQPVKIISLPESDIDTQEDLKTTGECENELRILYRPRGMDILSVHNDSN
ncbi:hypothetical protein SAMN04487784_3065 [Stenotrophomonas pavanii]|nr:hypothetical protein SAMN04487784_3065 [Stenotrophomonas pavanii]